MKKIILGIGLLILIFGCKKERCTTCGMTSNYPGLESHKSFCGTEKEITEEDARLKNEAATLNMENPGYSIQGGCD